MYWDARLASVARLALGNAMAISPTELAIYVRIHRDTRYDVLHTYIVLRNACMHACMHAVPFLPPLPPGIAAVTTTYLASFDGLGLTIEGGEVDEVS